MVPLIPTLRPQLLVNSRLVEGGKLDGSAHPSPVQTGRTSLPPFQHKPDAHLSPPNLPPRAPLPCQRERARRARRSAAQGGRHGPTLRPNRPATEPPCERTARPPRLTPAALRRRLLRPPPRGSCPQVFAGPRLRAQFKSQTLKMPPARSLEVVFSQFDLILVRAASLTLRAVPALGFTPFLVVVVGRSSVCH